MIAKAPKNTVGEWIATYPAEIMVCDKNGIVLEMSDVAIKIYGQEGGAKMIGRNAFDHHKETARALYLRAGGLQGTGVHRAVASGRRVCRLRADRPRPARGAPSYRKRPATAQS